MSQDAAYNEQLVAALASSTSYDAGERTAALSFLEQHQAEQGFQYELVKVVAAKSLPVAVRTQAILYFKNGLEKYWRKGTANAVNPANKQLIRQKLLTLVDEDDRTIAKTLALCIGKIARADYDQDWPDLFTILTGTMSQALQNSAGMPNARLILHRCLLIFQQCVKLLSQNRISRGKMILGRLCEQTLPTLIQLYQHFFAAALASLSSDQSFVETPSQPEDLELSLLTLKIIAKLVVYGWGGAIPLSEEERPLKAAFTETQKQFFHSTIPDLVKLQEVRKAKALGNQLIDGSPLTVLNKHVRQYGKFYKALLVQNHHTFHSLGATKQLIDIFWSYVIDAASNLQQYVSDDATAVYPESFLVESLLLVKSCFTQFPTAWSQKDPELAAQMADTIVSQLLPLRAGDLEKWQADPEEWIKDEEEERWQFDLRPCAETMLKDLVKEYTDTVGPRLAQYMHQAASAAAFNEILLKEAIYTAFGNSPTELNKFMPFGTWLDTLLIPDAQSTEPNQLIIRRRVAWTVGNWVGEDASAQTQSKIYQVICHLIQKNASTDLATRLTAAKALGQCDLWEMDKAAFLPYLEVSMRELANLLDEVELPETQMKINNILGIIISRVGKDIRPYLEQLMQILPKLWSNAESEHLFKSSIIVTFKKLVEALETDSAVLHEPCSQLVRFACDPASPEHVFHQEDGLELWKSLLRFSESPSPPLRNLAPIAVSLLPESTDLLPRVLRLLESYVLIEPAAFVPTHIMAIFSHFAKLLRELDDKAVKPILYAADMMIASTSISAWAPALDASGMISGILEVVTSVESTMAAVTRRLCTLARIAIFDANTFHQLIQRALQQDPLVSKGMSYDELLKKLLAQFLDRYDNHTYPGQRKLIALALTYLVRTTNPIILDRFDEIVTIWLSALGETEEDAAGECVSSLSVDLGPPDAALPSQPYEPSPSPVYSSHTRSGSSSPSIFDHDAQSQWIAYPHSSQQTQHTTYSDSCDEIEQQYRRGSTTLTTPSPSPASPVWGTVSPKIRDSCMDDDEAETTGHPWSAENTGDGGSWGGDGDTYREGEAIVSKDYTDWENPSSTLSTPVPQTTCGTSLFDLYNTPNPPLVSAGGSYCGDLSAQSYYNDDETEEGFDPGWGDGWGADPNESKIPENERLNTLRKQDPIHTHKLTVVISAAIQETQNMNGGPELFAQNVLAGIEPAVLQELTERLQGLARAGD